MPTPQQHLDGFIDKFTPEMAARIRACLAGLRRVVPGAVEMVYDNYNFFVVGFGPSDRPSEAVFSIAAQSKGVALCFLQGASLPDPDKRLRGSGNLVRNIRLEGASDLDDPAVRKLIAAAIARSKVPFDPRAKRKLIIRSISTKQRPRRPAAARATTARPRRKRIAGKR